MYSKMLPRWMLLCCVVLFARPVHPQGAQQCPPQNTITPCTCTVKKNGLDILCEFTEQQHIQKAMNTLRSKPMIIFYLKLRHNNLAKLPSYIFLSLDIRHLTVHNSSLAVIEDSSLSSIGNKLTQLDVSQNNLATIPTSSFTHLNHLLILNMNHNKVTAIHNRAFLGLDTLEILTLYENRISVIDGEAFKGLEKKLKRLNLGGNELTAIPQKALALLENLKKLEMQENRITSISEGNFAGLRSLDSLGLAHNQLREVPANVFSHLTFLNSLELEGNQIQRIDEKAFAGLEENLQYLRLGDNRLHEIPSEALRPLHRLRHLDLRSNNITYISEDAFSGYGDSITFLNLQKNMVHQLPTMGFDNLNSLETLNLQNNKLHHIPEEIMEPILDTLRVVDIMDNPLICDCDLAWYENWLAGLKDRDDEMMQKKRTICTMVSEHREYSVAKMPLDKMSCKRKPGVRASSATNVCPLLLAHYITFAVTMQVARVGFLKKQNNPVREFIRNTSCSRGWLRIAVHIFFGAIIVISFILIVLMALGQPRQQNASLHSRCIVIQCTVKCNETPYYGSYEEQIINAVSEASSNCENVALQLNEPTFRSGIVPENWLSRIHSPVRELTIFGGNIKFISPYAFMTIFGNNLRTLILEKIEISFWQYDMLLGLSNLERLHIIDGIFGTIERKAIKAVDGSLRFLKIMSNSHWDPINITGSAQTTTLKVVDFSSNNLEYNLQNASFSKINHCQVLLLNSCNIKAIGSGTFDHLKDIEVLYLNDNHLVTIPVGLFDKILPLRPRIALQDNLWHCDCSVTDLRKLTVKDLLIVDPVCRFPDAVHGLSFSDFEGYCQEDPVIETVISKINNNSVVSIPNLKLWHNMSETVYMNRTCQDKVTPIRVFPYKQNKCVLNRISSKDMSWIYYNVNHDMMSSSSDWIKPLYVVENNPYSMLEIAASEEPGLGLLWYRSSCINEIYCVNTIPNSLKIYNMHSGIYYVFCPFTLAFGTILTEKCISYDLNNFGRVKTFSEKSLITIIVISIGCLLGGAITVYALIHKNPYLLKGNKRVIFVKHKSIKALILPPQSSKLNNIVSEPSTITKHVFEKQIFLIPDNLNTLSPQSYLRSISMRSSDSNEAGYISPLQPTEEQLSEWRSNQIVKQLNDTVTSDSETLATSCIYDSDSLPYYYVPIHTNERIYEVPK